MPALIKFGREHWWHAVVVVLGAGFAVFAIARLHTASTQLDSLRSAQAQQSRLVTDLASGLSGAQSQLKAHGIQPKQPPPSQIMQQAGPQGPAGPSGPPGPSGPSGPSGATGPAGAAGASGASGAPGSPGPTGPAGQNGSPGQTGAQGSPGVPGPTGPSGVSGAPGASGASGAPGSPGPTGPTGAAGPPGAAGRDPSGWVYTDALGMNHTCLPDSATPSPHYTCH